MDVVLLGLRLLLAGVLAVAGLAKLSDRTGTGRAVSGFGVPAAVTPVVAAALPVVELALAAGLVVGFSAWWAALATLVLLLSFAAGIGVNLARGRRPDCRCFGQLSATPLGWRTLARTGLLAAAAAAVAAAGPTAAGLGPVGWLESLEPGTRVAVVASALGLTLVAAQGWLVVHVLRQSGRLLLRVESLEAALGLAPVGVPAPDPASAGGLELYPMPTVPPSGPPLTGEAPAFSLPDVDGRSVHLDDLRAEGRPVVLVFSDHECGSCAPLYPHVAHWQDHHRDQMTVVLVSRGPADALRATRDEHELTYVLVDADSAVANSYRTPGTPSAVVVGVDGDVDGDMVAGSGAIFDLVARTVREAEPEPASV